MTRRVSLARQQNAAVQAGRRMIARGDHPAYRVTAPEDGRWRVDKRVPVTAIGGRGALDEARAAIAEWLGVPPEAFDVEGG